MRTQEVPAVYEGQPSVPGKALMLGGVVTWLAGVVEIVRGTLAHVSDLRPELYERLTEAMSTNELYYGIGGVVLGGAAFALGIRVEDNKDSPA